MIIWNNERSNYDNFCNNFYSENNDIVENYTSSPSGCKGDCCSKYIDNNATSWEYLKNQEKKGGWGGISNKHFPKLGGPKTVTDSAFKGFFILPFRFNPDIINQIIKWLPYVGVCNDYLKTGFRNCLNKRPHRYNRPAIRALDTFNIGEEVVCNYGLPLTQNQKIFAIEKINNYFGLGQISQENQDKYIKALTALNQDNQILYLKFSNIRDTIIKTYLNPFSSYNYINGKWQGGGIDLSDSIEAQCPTDTNKYSFIKYKGVCPNLSSSDVLSTSKKGLNDCKKACLGNDKCVGFNWNSIPSSTQKNTKDDWGATMGALTGLTAGTVFGGAAAFGFLGRRLGSENTCQLVSNSCEQPKIQEGNSTTNFYQLNTNKVNNTNRRKLMKGGPGSDWSGFTACAMGLTAINKFFEPTPPPTTTTTPTPPPPMPTNKKEVYICIPRRNFTKVENFIDNNQSGLLNMFVDKYGHKVTFGSFNNKTIKTLKTQINNGKKGGFPVTCLGPIPKDIAVWLKTQGLVIQIYDNANDCKDNCRSILINLNITISGSVNSTGTNLSFGLFLDNQQSLTGNGEIEEQVRRIIAVAISPNYYQGIGQCTNRILSLTQKI